MESRLLCKLVLLTAALAGIAAGAQAAPLIYSAVIGTTTNPYTLTLLGTGFSPTGGRPTIYFDDVLLTVQSYSNIGLVVNMPASPSPIRLAPTMFWSPRER